MLRAERRRGDPFQVAIIDYLMPEMDGAMTGYAIQQDPEIRDTSLILYSSAALNPHDPWLNKTAFIARLSKPARAAKLRETIVRAVHGQDVKPIVPQAQEPDLLGVAPRRVLVAEDNIVNQKVATMLLNRLGCRVEVAANGKEAVELASHLPFDLIFMDCQMPEMDGLSASREIRRRNPEGNRIPIVAMTADATAENRLACLNAGMDDVVNKPITPDRVRAALDRWTPRGATPGRHQQV
jgi:CheY-like chemotaxis protein